MISTLLPQAIINGLLLGLVYTLISVGLSLTLGVMGIVNVAHSTLIMLGSFLALELLQRFGLDPIISAIIAIPVFFLIGILLEKALISRVAQTSQTTGLLVLFGVLVIIEGASILRWTTDTQVLNVSYSNASLALGTILVSVPRLIAAGIALFLVLLCDIFLRRTLYGKGIRAMSQSPDAARMLGVNTDWMSMIVFGLGAATAGVGGVVLAMIFPFDPQDHYRWLAWAFLAVVVGGLGSVRNTLIAGLVIGLLESLSGIFFPFQYVYFVVYLLLVLALLLRSQGLAGKQSRTI
ncbi:MAG: branched-chain amino acid ABC transporter permease [Ktedonobacteraceae bacterium]